MTKTMLIDAANQEEVRVCLLENGKVEDFDFEYASRKPLRGNIYLARVTRVEPSLQAAFIEYGGNRHGFLAFNEIHPDYYQIPISDRRAIQEVEAEEAALAAQLNLSPSSEDDDGLDEFDDEDGDAEDARPKRRERSPRRDAASRADAAPEDNGDDDNGDNGNGEDSAPADHAADDAAAETFETEESVADDGAVNGDDDDDDDVEDEEEVDGGDDEDGDDEDEDGDDDLEDEDAEAAAENEDENDDAVEADDLRADSDGASDDDADADGDDSGKDDSGDGDSGENGPAEPAMSRQTRAALIERYKEARRKRARLLRNYKIQEVIKRRQILLVQVVKEERGTKGAALTTFLSLAGRYCVLMPNTARGGGISRKIPMASDRKRLRRIVDALEVPGGMGLIIRTAGAKRTKAEIKRDYEYLTRLWENIRNLTLQSIAPALIYEEANLIKRAIRDLYDKDVGQVLVEGENGYREAKDFMRMLMPSHAKNVQPYKDAAPLFLKYGVEAQLDAMYQPIVRLKSGGYIVINQTEALIAIDVNSGKSTRERNIEQTALRTNLEAADEAARQCRMRDLAGLIVIDFIDMEEGRNNRSVEKRLKDALRADRARIQVGRISNFGLLEMSRQRRRSGIIDGTTHSCPACGGAGVVRSNEMAALRILRAVETEAIAGKAGRLVVKASPDVALYILNHKRDWLRRIEEAYGVSVELAASPDKAGDLFEVEKSGVRRDVAAPSVVVRADTRETIEAPDDEAEAADIEDDSDEDQDANAGTAAATERDGGRRRRRRRRRGRRDDRDGADADHGATVESADPSSAPRAAAGDGEESSVDGDEQPFVDLEGSEEGAARARNGAPGADSAEGERLRKRRRRGRRGGRRNARRDGEDGAGNAAAGDDAGDDAPAEQSAEPAEFFDREAIDDDRHPDDTADPLDSIPDAPSQPRLPAAAEPAPEPALAGEDDDAPTMTEPAAEPAAAEPAPKEQKPEKPARRGWWNRVAG